VRTEIGLWTKPAILGTIVASAAMNALAFGAQTDGWMLYPAVGLGLAIPALIYCLSRVAFGLAATRQTLTPLRPCRAGGGLSAS
jgi:hypothetical protein